MNKRIIKKLFTWKLRFFLLSILSVPALAQNSFTAQELAGQIYLVEGGGANVLVYAGTDTLTLVDAGNASNAKSLLDFLEQKFPQKKTTTLFNTHWHLEQTGANELLANSSVEIIAHQNTKLWMGTEIISKWNEQTYPPRNALAAPTKTFFYGSETLVLNSATTEYGLLPQGHTDGDIYVYFPEQNVFAGGDVISGGAYPLFDYSSGGWIGGMINSLQIILEKTNADTVYVPAQGSLRTRSDIEAQLALCEAIVRAVTRSFYAGETYQEFLASSPLAEVKSAWSGDVALFLHTAYEGSWGHVTELRRYR